MKPAVKRWVLIGVGIAGGLIAGIWALAAYLPLELIDFNHYLRASAMLWQGQDPYGRVEFFAPPWLAVLLGPFLWLPSRLASAIWVLMCLGCVCATTVLAAQWLNFPEAPRWRVLALFGAALMPAALYVYITGQLSALVGLAIMVVIRGITSKRRLDVGFVAGLALVTLKPHIVALPTLLCGLELIRRREWKALGWSAVGLALLMGIAFALLPNWPVSLLRALLAGAYRGGPGLVASGYVGFDEIGIPAWLFAPLAAYALILWWRAGLTAHVAALALAVSLLVTPYSRSYDLVILIFPALTSLAHASGALRWGAGLLVLAALGLAPLVGLALTAPAFIAIALLWLAGPHHFTPFSY